ncbi:3'-5' exonuclease [Porphyromonas endodontalis]
MIIALLSLFVALGLAALFTYKRVSRHPHTTSCSKEIRIKEKTISKRPHSIVLFDTDTTGLPNAPIQQEEDSPELIQLAWCVLDSHLREIKRCNRFISGINVPSEATAIHGITPEELKQKGEAARSVLLEFLNDWDGDTLLVAHNLAFDLHILGKALERAGCTQGQIRKVSCHAAQYSYCTMLETCNLCKLPHLEHTNARAIPHQEPYKYPRLGELHSFLFGNDPTGETHDAVQDLDTCIRCFYQLIKSGHICIKREK